MGNKSVKLTKPTTTSVSDSIKSTDPKSAPRGKWGLYTTGQDLPLKSVSVNCKIRDCVADWVIKQSYHNDITDPQEAVCEFALGETDGVLCGLDVEIGKKHIVAQVKEKQQAQDKYDDSISSGHGAYLLEEKKTGVFTLSVGSIAPDESLSLEMRISSELRLHENVLVFPIPDSVFPLHGYELSLKFDVEQSFPISSLKCTMEKCNVTSSGTKGSVEFKGTSEDLPTHFQLTIEPSWEATTPSFLLEKHPKDNTYAALVSFFPSWKHVDPDLLEPQFELVFCVDCSGSMSGSRIKQAAQTLKLFLNSLPPNSKFNIYRFGSKFDSVWPESVDYNDETLEQGLKVAESLEASYGGTELLPPLKSMFSKPYFDNFPRQIFILTDGAVSNTTSVLQFAAVQSRAARIFTCGIGSGADEELVTGLAREGKGEAVMIADAQEMESKVIGQLKKALEPCLTNVKIDWGGLTVQQAPFVIRPIFNGERMVLYGIVSSEVDGPRTLKLSGLGPEAETLTFEVKADPSCVVSGTTIHTLCASQMIRDLLDEKSHFGFLESDRMEKEIIKLGTKYNIASKFTSFVAVNKRSEAIEGTMVLKKIPTSQPERKAVQSSSSSSSSSSNYGMLFGGIGASANLSKKAKSGPTGFFRSSEATNAQSFSSNIAPVAAVDSESSDECDEGLQRHSTRRASPKFFAAEESSALFKDSKPNKDKKKKDKEVSRERLTRMDDVLSENNNNNNNRFESEESPVPKPTLTVNSQQPPAPPSGASAPRSGLLTYKIVSGKQKASGLWTLEHIAWLTKLSEEAIKEGNPLKEFPENNNTHQEVWSTILGCALLQALFSASAAEWGLVFAKAKKFIKKALIQNKSTDTFEDLLQKALSWVKKNPVTN